MPVQFCKDCNNILYPKYENKTYLLGCNKCNVYEDTASSIVYEKNKNENAEHKNIKYFLDDVTLPVVSKKCTKCENNRCVSYMRKSEEKALDEYYICTSCMYEFTD